MPYGPKWEQQETERERWREEGREMSMNVGLNLTEDMKRSVIEY
jgi:hypothetical protein